MRQGVLDAASSGVVQGYPVVDVQIELRDATFRQEDSSPLAFQIVAGQAFAVPWKPPNPVLLEPVMRLEVLVPEEFLGSVIGGLAEPPGPH